jgi:hypothetical protein
MNVGVRGSRIVLTMARMTRRRLNRAPLPFTPQAGGE